MATSRTFLYAPVLSLCALVCFVASYWFAFQAGCAGDSKGGSLGNPVRALELEAISVPFFFAGALSVIALIALHIKFTHHNRIKYSLVFAFPGPPLLWLLAVQFELWGTQQCF